MIYHYSYYTRLSCTLLKWNVMLAKITTLLLICQMRNINRQCKSKALAQNRRNSLLCTVRTSSQKGCNYSEGCLLGVTEPNTPEFEQKRRYWLTLVLLGCWTWYQSVIRKVVIPVSSWIWLGQSSTEKEQLYRIAKKKILREKLIITSNRLRCADVKL